MTDTRLETRAAIVAVAAHLLQQLGASAVTTRAVAQAAGVQAPTIYRLFGDKEGLLDAVAEHVMATYVATKAPGTGDPMDDLRAGWDRHIEFSLANPALFRLLADPERGVRSPAARAGREVLRQRLHRVAAAGRLRVGEERAAQLIHSTGNGAVLTLLSMPPEARDLSLTDAAYDAIAQAIFTDAAPPASDDVITGAITFRTLVPRLEALTAAERSVLSEWLTRVIES